MPENCQKSIKNYVKKGNLPYQVIRMCHKDTIVEYILDHKEYFRSRIKNPKNIPTSMGI